MLVEMYTNGVNCEVLTCSKGFYYSFWLDLAKYKEKEGLISHINRILYVYALTEQTEQIQGKSCHTTLL